MLSWQYLSQVDKADNNDDDETHVQRQPKASRRMIMITSGQVGWCSVCDCNTNQLTNQQQTFVSVGQFPPSLFRCSFWKLDGQQERGDVAETMPTRTTTTATSGETRAHFLGLSLTVLCILCMGLSSRVYLEIHARVREFGQR